MSMLPPPARMLWRLIGARRYAAHVREIRAVATQPRTGNSGAGTPTQDGRTPAAHELTKGDSVTDDHLPQPAPIPADDLSRSLTVARPDQDLSLPHIGLVGDTYTIL